jgi:putative transposase
VSKRLSHVARPTHWTSTPVHLTLRARGDLASFRCVDVFIPIARALRCSSNERFRIVHFSVQPDHLHLLCEADDAEALCLGAQGASIRLAKTINRALGRTGKVWRDRHERHDLRTPREVRNALVYVLFNHRKHARGTPGEAWAMRSLDPRSSAAWFDGWNEHATAARETLAKEMCVPLEPAPVVHATKWLLTTGWRKHGLVDAAECPRLG